MSVITNQAANAVVYGWLWMPGNAITGTLQSVQDGLGNTAPIQLSTGYINITALKYNGNIVTLGSTLTTVGAFSTAGAFSTVGAYSTTLTMTNTTTLTLPTIGTLATLAGVETFTNKTLTSPIFSTISNSGTLTLPTTTDTLVGRATTDTLTNKTLTAPVIATISNSGTITLPTGTRTLVAKDTTDTLTNKTLTAPIISTISNTGTITLPTSSDTLVGRATTDTLTNKTLTTPVINGTITGTTIIPLANGGSGLAVTDPVVQRVSTLVSTAATGSTVIPTDDTIPQNTEGDQYMSLSITPKNIANILVIDVCAPIANSSASSKAMIISLFQDSTAGALSATQENNASAGFVHNLRLRYIMAAGTTSATTFKVRAGSNVAGTTTFCGTAGGRLFGGVMNAYITITEYAT